MYISFLNPFNPKRNDSIRTVLDARHLNSNTDQLSKSWPPEFIAIQVNEDKNLLSAIDLMYAHAHATFDDETAKMTGFASSDELLAFI